MPLPKNRSTSMKRKYVRVPRGIVIHYHRKKQGTAHCGLCHAILGGTTNKRGIAKTKRRPERKFGGNLCPACTVRAVKAAARVADGRAVLESIPISLRAYVAPLVKKK